MFGNISLETPTIGNSNKILMFTTILVFIAMYMYTPKFAMTIDDNEENTPKKHLGIILATSLLLGFTASFFYILQFITLRKATTEVNLTNVDRKTIVGNFI